MAARKDLTRKRLERENKHLLLESTNEALKAAKDIIANKENGQRVGAIQSILRSGLTPSKQSYPAVDLDISPDLPPLEQAQKVIAQTLTGKLSADHGQLLVNTLLSVEQLKHDIKFVQRFSELQAYIGADKLDLIAQISQLKAELAQAKGH